MNLWPVEHFFPLFFPDQHWISTDLEKNGGKSVQLVRGSFFRKYFRGVIELNSLNENKNQGKSSQYAHFSTFVFVNFRQIYQIPRWWFMGSRIWKISSLMYGWPPLKLKWFSGSRRREDLVNIISGSRKTVAVENFLLRLAGRGNWAHYVKFEFWWQFLYRMVCV